MCPGFQAVTPAGYLTLSSLLFLLPHSYHRLGRRLSRSTRANLTNSLLPKNTNTYANKTTTASTERVVAMAPQQPEEQMSHQKSPCLDHQGTCAECDDSALTPSATGKRKRRMRQGEKEHIHDTAIETATSSTVMSQGQQQSLGQSCDTASVMRRFRPSMSLPMELSVQRNILPSAEGPLESLDASHGREQTKSQPRSNLRLTAPPRTELALQLRKGPDCRVAIVLGVRNHVFNSESAVPLQELSGLAEIIACPVDGADFLPAVITSHLLKVSGLKEIPECCIPGAKVHSSQEYHVLELYLYRLGNMLAVMQHLHSWESPLAVEQENLMLLARGHILLFLKSQFELLLNKTLETIGSRSKDNLLKPRFTHQVKTLQLCLQRALDIFQTLYPADLFQHVKMDLETEIVSLGELIPASQDLAPGEGCKDCFQKLFPLSSPTIGKCRIVYFACYLRLNPGSQPPILQSIVKPAQVQTALEGIQQKNIEYLFNYAAF